MPPYYCCQLEAGTPSATSRLGTPLCPPLLPLPATAGTPCATPRLGILLCPVSIASYSRDLPLVMSGPETPLCHPQAGDLCSTPLAVPGTLAASPQLPGAEPQTLRTRWGGPTRDHLAPQKAASSGAGTIAVSPLTPGAGCQGRAPPNPRRKRRLRRPHGTNPARGAHLPPLRRAGRCLEPPLPASRLSGCRAHGVAAGAGRRAMPGSSKSCFPMSHPRRRSRRRSPKQLHFLVRGWIKVPAPRASQRPPAPGCGRGQGKVNPHPRREKQAIKNQSTCWNAAILGHAREGRWRTAPRGGEEHPWGQQQRDGGSRRRCPSREEGEAGAALGAGDPPRGTPTPPLRCSGGGRGGLAAGAGGAPSAWLGMLRAGAAPGGETGPNHGPALGVQDPAFDTLRRGRQEGGTEGI